MKKDTLLIVGIVVLAGLLLINLLVPDPIPLLDEGAMLGALIWLVRQKMMMGEEPRVGMHKRRNWMTTIARAIHPSLLTGNDPFRGGV